MKNIKNEIELQILLALFKATVEQMAMLTGNFKHQIKQVFGRWVKQGNLTLNVIERLAGDIGNEEHYNEITDTIHKGINELRKEYYESFETSVK